MSRGTAFSVILAVGAAACGSSVDGTAALEAPLAGAASHALVPTSPSVAEACAAEVGATYCDSGAIAAADARCRARLTPEIVASCDDDKGCLLDYAPERTKCRAGPTYVTRAACEIPVADDCSFYRSCLEASNPCGAQGYALSYGERICHRFIAERETFTPHGQAWLRGIRSCLQRALVPLLHARTTCDSLLDAAYATHADCYTAPENSICALSPADVVSLVRVLSKDLLTARALHQVREVAATCGREHLGLHAMDQESL